MSHASTIVARFVVVLAIGWVVCPAPAFAACPRHPVGGGSWFESDWLVTYDGTIGDRFPVRMTLVFDGDNLNGKYFYTKTLKDIRVEGTVSDDRMVTLNEYDAKGAVIARFTGKFLEEDPKGGYAPGTKLTCEAMSGNWESLSSGQTYAFELRLIHAVVGSLSNRYRSLGVGDDSVENLAQSFLRAVRENDRNKVASLVEYPFSLSLLENNRPRSITIRNKTELLRNYESVFGSAYKDRLEGAIPKHMFFRKGYIMVGKNGAPWITPTGKIKPFDS